MNRDRESVATLLCFGIHVRISKLTRTFEFRTISVSVSPQKFLKRSRSSSFAIETGNNIMIFVKSQELCVSVEILGHVAAICEFCEGGEVTPPPPPIPSPPLIPPILPPSSPPPTSPPPHFPHSQKETISRDSIYKFFGAQELTRNEFRQPMYPELVFIKSLWGLGTEAEFIPWNRFMCSINVLKYGFLLYIGWRNSFLRRRIDSLAPQTF